MENVRHEKEEEGIFYGAFSFMTEGPFAGLYEAKCSHACINIILQQSRFVDGLAVSMNDETLKQTIVGLHISKYFGLPYISEMENLFLVNWKPGDLEIFGSLLAMYQVLKSEELTLLPLTANLHPAVSSANSSPENMKAYLYLLDHHWMVLRQLGKQWYKFDPWLPGPQLLTHFYVSLYIKQLLADGRLVFVIEGNFPPCPADVETQPEEEVIEPEQPNLDSEGKPSVDLTPDEISESLRFLDLVFEGEDNELALALLLSLEDEVRRNKSEEDLAAKLLPTSSLPSTSCPVQLPPAPSGEAGSSVEVSSAERLVTDANLSSPIRRKNGTVLNPLIVESQHEILCNRSFDSDDLVEPFSIMFNEPGEGARCLDSPPTAEIQVDQPAQPTSAPAASIVISSSELSSFKKSVVRGEGSEASAANSDTTEEHNCCVCWTEARSHVVVPCGHFCLCSSCSISILKPQPDKSFCPLCKQETTAIIKLY